MITFLRYIGEQLSRGRVIFVEDEETLRKLGETILTRMGFEVSAHGDAESALEIIVNNHDIVLLATDMSLPGMNGVNLAHKVRQLGINAPVLLMSGHDEEEINEALEIKVILSKSIDEMELSVRSHNCLQAAGIRTIGELVSKEESEMLKFKNFGRKSLTELQEKLGSLELQFGMDVQQYLDRE